MNKAEALSFRVGTETCGGYFFRQTPGKGLLVLLHGYYSGANELLDFFPPVRFPFVNVAAVDLPGHGHSFGLPGTVFAPERYVAVVVAFLNCLEKRNTNFAPILLLGVSLGGNVAFRCAASELLSARVAAVVLVSPFLGFGRLAYHNNRLLAGFSSVLRRFAFWLPPIEVPGLTWHPLRVVPEVHRAYKENLVVKRATLSAQSVSNLIELVVDLHRHFARMEKHLLLLHGKCDNVASYAMSKRLFEKESKNKYFVSFESNDHFLVKDENEAVSLLVANFLRVHLFN